MTTRFVEDRYNIINNIINNIKCNSNYSTIKDDITLSLSTSSSTSTTNENDNRTFRKINYYNKFNTKDIRHYIRKDYINIIELLEKITNKYFNDNKKNDINNYIEYIASGAHGLAYKDYNNNFAIKFISHKKNKNKEKNIYSITNEVNVELLTIICLSQLITNKKTPHLINPIMTFYTETNIIVQSAIRLKNKFIQHKKKNNLDRSQKEHIERSIKNLSEYIDKYEKNKIEKITSGIITEYANCGDLLSFIKRNLNLGKIINLEIWRNILFQIIFNLELLQTNFIGFRHNDLKANNILISEIIISKKNGGITYKISNPEKNFHLPNIGYRIFLWDFDFACIPFVSNKIPINRDFLDKILNEKIESKNFKKYNITSDKNDYYDLHFFINSLCNQFIHNFYKSELIPEEVKEFTKRIVPNELAGWEKKDVTCRGRILNNIEHTTPKKILQNDPFFYPYVKNYNKLIDLVNGYNKLNMD